MSLHPGCYAASSPPSSLSPRYPHFPLTHLPDDILHIIISILARQNHESPRGSTRPQTPSFLDRGPLLALSATNHHLRGLCLPQVLSSIHLGASPPARAALQDGRHSCEAGGKLSDPLAWLSTHPLATAHVRTLHFHAWYAGEAKAAATAGLAAPAPGLDPSSPAEAARRPVPAGSAGQQQPQQQKERGEHARRVTCELARALGRFRNLRAIRVEDDRRFADETGENGGVRGEGHGRGSMDGLEEEEEVACDGLLLLKNLVDEGRVEGLELPRVTELVLAPHAEWLVAHCPNVRSIASTEWESREDWESDSAERERQQRGRTRMPWVGPEVLIEAAGRARGLVRFEMRGLFQKPEVEKVVEAMPGLRELRLDGNTALSWESVVPALQRLLILDRLEVTKLQMHLMNGDWLRKGTFSAMEHPVLPQDAERFVRMVFRSLPQLRTLVVDGAFQADVVVPGGWDECRWNERQTIRVVLGLFGEPVQFNVSLKNGDTPTLYTVAKLQHGGHIQDGLTVS